jgi:hypothetical protein
MPEKGIQVDVLFNEVVFKIIPDDAVVETPLPETSLDDVPLAGFARNCRLE